MNNIGKMLDKQMTRKQFLTTLGLGLVAITGIPVALKLLQRPEPESLAPGSTTADNWHWLLHEHAKFADPKKPAPSGDGLCRLPAYEQLALMNRRTNRVSAVDLTEAHLTRINKLNAGLNAFVYIAAAQARDAARASEKRYHDGNPRPLEGLSFAVKDLFDFWAGVPNTFGSRPMKDFGFVPPFTETYIQRAFDAGVVPLGKTNTPEFGHKGVTDNLVYGPTSTPFDLRFNAGGSSGGSAAATAAGLAALAQGSDAGGSVRIPAAMCGVVAHKPSVGRWPQDVPPFASTPFFTPGPITRTITDAAMLMQTISGPYAGDPLTMDGALDYLAAIRNGFQEKSLQGKKIAYTANMDLFPVDPAVKQVVHDALDAFKQAGATVTDVPLGLDKIMITDVGGMNRRPLTSMELSQAWVKMQAGLYGHARDLFLEFGIPLDLRQHKSELTPEFAHMLDMSEAMSAEQYRHLDFLRADILRAFNAVLEKYDYIVSPTLAVAGVQNAKDRNTLGPTSVNGEPVDPQIGWCLTYPVNFTGHPAMSVPAGLTTNPLGGNKIPVGLQIIGRMHRDDEVFTAAAAFERQRPWYDQLPA